MDTRKLRSRRIRPKEAGLGATLRKPVSRRSAPNTPAALLVDESLVVLVVAASGSGLVAASPVGPAEPVTGRVAGLVEMGVQPADLVDRERDQLAGFRTCRGGTIEMF